MGETSRTINMEELMTYSDNLIEILKEEKDIVGLKHFLKQSNALRTQCDKDFNEVQKSIEDYEKMIDSCKRKAAAAESESAADEELDQLQRDLEEEQRLEGVLREDLRVTINEIDGLECQRDSIEEQMQSIQKIGKEEMTAQMKLSMCASVTNIIPYLDDPSKISGYIVEREKKVIEKFEFDPPKATSFDTCNNIWKMINL